MSIVFNGRAFAKQKEERLVQEISRLDQKITVKSFTFVEDEGSVLYTKLKQQAAGRVGINFESIEVSLSDKVGDLVEKIYEASKQYNVNGVMVQKPAASVFQSGFPTDWWDELTAAILPEKDIDCLTKDNLIKIKEGKPLVLPATVQAVISILDEAKQVLNIGGQKWRDSRVAVIGRSNIVGKPLSWCLKERHNVVELFGRDNLPRDLTEFDIVVSAVGKEKLISGNLLKSGSIVIDVGAPRGDVDFESAVSETAFITPVPGGVGPVTVVSLLENIVLVNSSTKEL